MCTRETYLKTIFTSLLPLWILLKHCLNNQNRQLLLMKLCIITFTPVLLYFQDYIAYYWSLEQHI